jgi:hypothetical protein
VEWADLVQDRRKWWAVVGFIYCGEYFDCLRNCQLLKKKSCRGVSLLIVHCRLEAEVSNSSLVSPKFHTLPSSFHRRSVILVSEGFVNKVPISSQCIKQIAVAIMNTESSVRIMFLWLLKRVFR